MYKLFDYKCDSCRRIDEMLIKFRAAEGQSAPKCYCTWCHTCDKMTSHSVVPVCKFADYVSDKIRAPVIYGGSYDTMGYGDIEPLPRIPEEYIERKEIVRDDGTSYTGNVVSADATLEHFQRKEWKEAKEKRTSDIRRNMEQRKKAAAIKSGMVRNDEQYSKGDR